MTLLINPTIRLLLLFLLLSPPLPARTFTSADGRELAASYRTSEDGQVTLKRTSDGQEFTIEMTRFSEEDQAEPHLVKPQVLIEKAKAFLDELPDGHTGPK